MDTPDTSRNHRENQATRPLSGVAREDGRQSDYTILKEEETTFVRKKEEHHEVYYTFYGLPFYHGGVAGPGMG
jgi:hypothetical protein